MDAKIDSVQPRSLLKSFLIFLGPMILGNVLQSFSGTINSVYLGHLVGVRAFAATTAFFPVMFFFMAFVIGFGSGASVLIGQAFGAKNTEKVKAVAGTTLAFGVVAGFAISVLGGMFALPLLKAVGTPGDILDNTVAYGRLILLMSPVLFPFLLSTTMMRGVGDTITPLIALAFSIVVGLVTTPALILGWGGLPKLGLIAAAYGGILSWILTLVFLTVYLRRRNHPLAPDRALLRHLWIDWRILRSVLRIGIPAALQMVLVSIAGVAVLSFVNGFGSNATAAYGAANQVASYIQFPAVSLAVAASIFAAQAIGRGDADHLGIIMRMGMYLNLALTGTLVAIAYVLSRFLIGFFVADPAVVEIAQRILHITLWSYVVMGASAILASIMRASGTVIAPMAIAIFSMAGIQVAAAYVLSHRFGIDGIWVAFPVSFVAMFSMQALWYRLVWRKKAVERLI